MQLHSCNLQMHLLRQHRIQPSSTPNLSRHCKLLEPFKKQLASTNSTLDANMAAKEATVLDLLAKQESPISNTGALRIHHLQRNPWPYHHQPTPPPTTRLHLLTCGNGQPGVWTNLCGELTLHQTQKVALETLT